MALGVSQGWSWQRQKCGSDSTLVMAVVSVVAETHVGPTGLQFCFILVEQLSILWKFIFSL